MHASTQRRFCRSLLASGDTFACCIMQIIAGIVALRSLRSWFLEHDEEAANAFERPFDAPYEVEKVRSGVKSSVHDRMMMRIDGDI